MPDRGRPFDVRSCPYVGRNPAEYSVTGFINGKRSIWIAQQRLSAWRQAAKLRLRLADIFKFETVAPTAFDVTAKIKGGKGDGAPRSGK